MGEKDPIFVVDDEYFFRDPHTGDHVGPYDTKQDAIDDLRGLIRFYRQEKETMKWRVQ